MRTILLFLWVTQCFYAQKNYPKDYFISPLEIPLHLSGNFGELRNNHFHSGLDFKTQQKEGLKVFASADGYVSRIKVSAWGYGKALYITHPNGYTTVYAHLQKYAPEIEEYVKKGQYRQKSFEVEFFPNPSELRVKQGQLIAFSGNSGGSGGPHLHFEIRDSKTENIINPLFFGFDELIADTKKPNINNVYVYPVGENSHANNSENPTSVPLSLQKDGTYLAQTVLADGKIGFGISTYDMFDFNYNKNGVYKIETFLNGTPAFSITFNEFAFAETRYINAYIDYEKLVKQKSFVQKMFMENNYPLSLVGTNKKNGIIEIIPNVSYTYKMEVSDYHSNKIEIIIPIKHTTESPKIKRKHLETQYVLKSQIENLYEKENVSVYVAPNTFYQDFALQFEVNNGILTFADNTIPVHKNYTITFKDTSIPDNLRNKTYIASLEGKSKKYNKTTVSGNLFKASTRNTGKFTLVQDTLAPIVKPVNFTQGKWISNEKELKVTIEDKDSGINTYEAYLNGAWILMEYDYKKKLLVHDFADGKVKEGKNELQVIVTDNVGNTTTFETYFFRSQKVAE